MKSLFLRLLSVSCFVVSSYASETGETLVQGPVPEQQNLFEEIIVTNLTLPSFAARQLEREKVVRLADPMALENAINKTTAGHTNLLWYTKFLTERLIGGTTYKIRDIDTILGCAMHDYLYRVKSEGMVPDLLAFETRMLFDYREEILRAIVDAR